MKKSNLILGLALLAAPLAGCNSGETVISVEQITLSETEINMVVGNSTSLVATVTPEDATDKSVTWSVTPEGIVSVNDGAVSAIAAGECVITAKAGEKEATCNVTVTDEAVPVDSVTLNQSSVEVEINATYQLVATVSPSNATNKKVTWESMDSSAVSVSENGLVKGLKISDSPVKVKATADGKTAECEVTVKDVPVNKKYYISEVNQNLNIQTYKLNTGAGTDYLGEIDRLQVGTDNSFVIKPSLLVYSEETDLPVDSSVWTYPYEYKIEELEGESFVDAKGTYAEFDSTNASFKFNNDAIGKTLKLSVMPGGLDDIDRADPRFTKTVEVDVAKGYNVYSAKELAYFDDPVNCNNRWVTEYSLSLEQTKAAWTAFRTANGLNTTYVADNIFLQSDIELTKNDIPSEFFYSEGQGGKVGYLRDTTDIYFRENRNTTFNGNYFDINTAKIPMADVDPDFDNISHTSLFKVYETRTDVAGNQIFKNCSYMGNGARSETETPKGGLILIKFTSNDNVLQSNVNFSNFNIEAATIALFVESYAKVIVNSCDIEQGYSNFMYVYNKGIIDVKKSIIKDFGGPAIVGDVDKDYEEQFCPIITIDNDTEIESWCCGEEPWFVSTKANVAFGQVAALNGFYTQTGLSNKTFLKELDGNQVLNCIYVSRSDAGSVYGSITFGETKMGIDYNSDAQLKGLYNGFTPYMPVLSTDAGGRVLVFKSELTGNQEILTDTFDLSALMGGSFNNLIGPAGVGNSIFTGNYLHLAMSDPNFGGITLITQLMNQPE